jgi:tyrosinase
MANGEERRPAIPPPVRIRQNVNNLTPNDTTLEVYRAGIRLMKARPLDDFRSWRYQAAIHDYPSPDNTFAARTDRIRPGRADPFAIDGENLPADRGRFWRKCQHQSWFFLPWHRMYLHHFEKIIIDLTGATNWALPYWNWDATDGPGRIPIPFRNPQLPNGGPNLLFVRERNTTPGSDVNRGNRFATDQQMGRGGLRPDGVRERPFEFLRPTVFAGNGEFGGASVHSHSGEGPADPSPPALRGAGILEGTPHGTIHVLTGGTGWMSSFVQAALDPIFWLHHCNIDRLWEVWIQRNSGNVNPDNPGLLDSPDPNPGWLDAPFAFHDATGGDGTLTPRKVLNTRKPPLSYEYDDTSDPLGGR